MDATNGTRTTLAEEWKSRLLITVTCLLFFETLTGLSIWLLPFSVPNQVMVLSHTVLGVAVLAPFGWYQLRHWRHYRQLPVSHMVLTGYFAMAATVAALVSGVVLTEQALVGPRIGRVWDLVHIVATLALVASTLPHMGLPVVRALRSSDRPAAQPLIRAQKRFGLALAGCIAVLALLIGAAAWSYRPAALSNGFPKDYSYVYGPNRPFAPSLATTATGGAFDARSLSGSMSCGSSGCHEEVLKEWQVSAHRYSAMDAGFQKVQKTMAEQNGAESTRYCGGCHDPISLFSGTKNIFAKDLTGLAGYQEGVSCIVCHAIKKTDVKGNANYVITQPKRYMFELRQGATAKFASDYLIRSYPRYHVASLSHKLFKTPEFCAACHKQFIDKEINRVGWVQLQNQYDNWRKGRWNKPGDPTKTIECRECHMPLERTADPGNGDDLDYNRSPDDGMHRSHRFLAANQVMPLLLKLPGAEEQVRLTEKWLRGEIDIPEIANKWKRGPAVPVELIVPPQVRPGQDVDVRVTMTNNKVGHEFPTGPLDIIQAWLHVRVTDQNGKVVYESGMRDARHFIQPGSFMLKAEPVDQYGNLIDKHNLWEMVGVRYRRAIFPGFSDQADFTFKCPPTIRQVAASPLAAEPGERLDVTVQLMYRKFDQYLLNFLFGESAGLTAPATVVSEDRATIRVRPAGAE